MAQTLGSTNRAQIHSPSLKKHELPPQDEEESSGQGSFPAVRVRVQGAAGFKLGHKQHS